jgi:spore coat protein U domain-containing protein, fimbrial subunit CupE1/2/3/6
MKAIAGIVRAATVLVLFHIASGFAATTGTTFQVSATVGNSCSATASNLSFGAYDPLSILPNDATSTITVQCTLLTTYDVGMDAGTGSGASVSTRKMTKSSETLSYSLYRDATRLLVWGNTVSSDTVQGVGTGLSVPYTVYGRIPAGQNVSPGTYTDTISVTINF